MSKHAEVLAALAAPFPPEVIRHRPGVGGRDLTWVDARTVAGRLDEVLGVNGWDFEVEKVGDTNAVKGTLHVRFGDGTVAIRADFGYETGGSGESLKEAASDALRRCASLFGVARYLYAKENPAAPRITAPTGIVARAPEPMAGHDTVVLKAAMELFAADSCPDHGQPWAKKPGGVSKATGKPYNPFWACSGKTDGQWCKRKPSIEWVAKQTEPINTAGNEDLESLPF